MKNLWFRMPPNTDEGFGFRISALCFNDGTEIELSGDDVVVFVGPNNAGKTASLKEIVGRLAGTKTSIIRDVSFLHEGTPDQIRKWLDAHFADIGFGWEVYSGLGVARFHKRAFEDLAKEQIIAHLAGFVCGMVGTEQRLAATNPVRCPSAENRRAEHPLQRLFFKPEFEGTISAACNELFGFNLFLDRWAGEMLRLRCGDEPKEKPWSRAHREALDVLPRLENQGDGVRSLVGCLMETCGSPYLVALVDEPEAFLHRSHARRLGKMLVRNRRPGTQLFIATHSADLLCGILDGGSGGIRIVRICRDGASNRIRELRPEDIATFWSDSLIRSSNALDGLFHDKVVLCEGDADCRFYSCVLEAVSEGKEKLRQPDVMFISTGGKYRIPMLARALKALDVPIRVIADFDLLADEQNFRSTVEALGKAWATVESDWKVIFSALNSLSPLLALNQVRSEIQKILGEETGKYVSEEAAQKIRDRLQAVSPWSAVKRTGRASIPSGEAMKRYDILSTKLREVGLFLVEVGEVERFAPSLGAHGPAWVNAVLQKNLAQDHELQIAREFISAVVDIS